MMLFDTKRLIICEAKLEDTDFFFKLLNSPNWITYIGDRNIKTKENATDYIKNTLISSYTTNGYGLYKMVLKKDNQPIGICGFIKRSYLEHVDIGFAILPVYERKGYTSEAAKEMLRYGVSKLNLHPILAITTIKNTKSRNLLLKIGLKETGIIQPEAEKEELLLYSNE